MRRGKKSSRAGIIALAGLKEGRHNGRDGAESSASIVPRPPVVNLVVARRGPDRAAAAGHGQLAEASGTKVATAFWGVDAPVAERAFRGGYGREIG